MHLLNKILATLLVPVLTISFSPLMLVKKAIYRPTEIISLSEIGKDDLSRELKITAHRGVTAIAPENTLPAYEKSAELGFYAAECDIRLSSDQHWVLSHGADLNKHFWQFGSIGDFTFDELRTYSYKNGSNFWAYEDLKIPSFEEYLDVFAGTNTRPQIEIKEPGAYDKLYTVLDILEEKNMKEQAMILSGDYEQLRALRKLDPDVELWLIVIGDVKQEDVDLAVELGVENTWFTVNFDSSTEQGRKMAEDAGVTVSYGTFGTVEELQRLYDLGIRYVETDNICN